MLIMSEPLDLVTVHQVEEVVVLTIRLERVANYDLAQGMERELLAAVEGAPAPKVVVDLRHLVYMSSVGYGPFISLRVLVRDAGGRLVLCGLSPVLKEMFDATRLLINPRSPKSLFEFADSLEGAIALARS
jgi:anti-anti-sigma factor